MLLVKSIDNLMAAFGTITETVIHADSYDWLSRGYVRVRCPVCPLDADTMPRLIL